MSGILDEYEHDYKKTRLLKDIFLGAGIAAALAIFCVYVFVLGWGDRSISVFLKLQEQKDYLKTQIEKLKNENAALQKKFFELKMLFEGVE